MNELQTFKNELFEVAVKLENDEVMFEAEITARSLGFTQLKNGKLYVRWDRVNSYLTEVGFPHQVGKDDLIPESVVYLLAFKGETKLAMDFQKWLAIKVIPSIRKTGQYIKPLSEKEQLIASLKLTIETSEKVDQIESKVKTLEEKVELQITLDHGEQRRIQKAIGHKVYELEDDHEIRSMLFREIHRELKDRFAVASYKDIKRKDLQAAIRYIEAWIPRRVS